MSKENREMAEAIFNEWKKDRRIKQIDLAQRHGVAQQTVSKWIRMLEAESNA